MADTASRSVSDSLSPALSIVYEERAQLSVSARWSCESQSLMQVTIECIEPSGGSTGPKYQHDFPDRIYHCGFEKSPLDSERRLQWKRTRRSQDMSMSMSPARESVDMK